MAESVRNKEEIPMLDVKQMSADTDELMEMAEEVKHAFTTIGFLAVVNHGIPQNLVSICIMP